MGDIVITPASNDVNSTAGKLIVRTSDAQAMSLRTNDVSRIDITSAGNVGIGSETPNTKLRIDGSFSQKASGITNLQEYKNIATFSFDDFGTGGYVIKTPFRLGSTYEMAMVHVKGYGFANSTIYDFKTVFYDYEPSSQPINYSLVDLGNDCSPKFIAKDSSNYINICFGKTGDVNYFYRFTVDCITTRQTFDYSQGWGIYQTKANNFGFASTGIWSLPSPISFNAASNRVGIGTTNPAARLDVAGSVYLSSDILSNDGTRGFILSKDSVAGGRSYLILDPDSADGIGAGSDYLYIAQQNTTGVIDNTAGDIHISSNTLNVIGKNAAYPLGAGINQVGNVLRLKNSNSNLVLDVGGNGGNGNWLQSTNIGDLSLFYPLLLNPSGGNIGINTNSPSYQLDIFKTTNDSIARIRTAAAGAYVYLDSATDGWFGINMANQGTTKWFVGSYGGTAFTINRGIGGAEYFRLTSVGNLGLGTSTPLSLLAVGGPSSTTAASGLTFGADAQANLYRSAEDTIKTDGNLLVAGSLLNNNSASVGTFTKTISSNWGQWIKLNASNFDYSAHLINVTVDGGNLIWNGTFLVNGANSFTPNQTWNNCTLIEYSNYVTTVNDVVLYIMSDTAPNNYGSIGLALKTSATVDGGYGTGYANNVKVTIVGEKANTLNPTASWTRPFTYEMASSLNTKQIFYTTGGNVGIGIINPSDKLHVQGNIRLGADNAGNYVSYIKDTEGTIVRTARSDASQVGLFRSDGWGNFTFDKSVGIGYSMGSISYASSAIGNGNLSVSNSIGIGTTIGRFPLDNYGNTIRSLSRVSEKIIVVDFEHNVANQKVDIIFDVTPGTVVFWGNLEIEITDGFSNQLATGKLIKVFALGLNPAIGSGPYAAALYDNISYYTAAYGSVANNYAIDGVFFNTTTGKYYFTIIHRTSNGNVPIIKIKGFSSNVADSVNINSLTLSAVYTTNTTVYYKPVVETLQSRIGYNGNINQTASLIVDSYVGIGTTSPTTLLSIGGPGSTLPASGITFGADAQTNLYRLLEDVIKTDGAFQAAAYVYGGTYLQAGQGLIYPNSFNQNLRLNVGNVAQNAWDTGIFLTPGTYVGIGTSKPTGKLHVVSSVANETIFRADGTNGTIFSVVDDLSDSLMSVNNSAGLPVLEVYSDDRVIAGQYGSGDLVVKNNKVGIGRTSPAEKLDVNGNVRIGVTTNNTIGTSATFSLQTQAINIHPNSSTDTLYLRYLSNGNYQLQTVTSSANGGNLHLQPYAGNVGIAITNPAYKLDVSGDVRIVGNTATGGIIIRSNSNTQANIRPSVANGTILISDDSSSTNRGITVLNGGGATIGCLNTSYDMLTLQIGGTTNHVFKGDGSVGIGQSSPSAAKLHINGDGTNPVLRVENASLGSPAGGTSSKTFVAWLPIMTGAAAGDKVFIPLFK